MKKRLSRHAYFYISLLAIFLAVGIRVFISSVQANDQEVRAFYTPIALQTENKSSVEILNHSTENILHQLNDSVHHYINHSQSIGIPTLLKTKKDLAVYIDEAWLVPVTSNDKYFIDDFAYSYPYIIPKGKNLLNAIAKRFQVQLKDSKFPDTRFVVSSMIRTKSSIGKLTKVNTNAIEQSAHLHGTAFDISYEVFFTKTPQRNKDIAYLRNTLAQVLLTLRNEGKCWVTYEKKQACFHIVVK